MLRLFGFSAIALAFGIVLVHFLPPNIDSAAQLVASVEAQIATSTERLISRPKIQNAFLAIAATHANDTLALEKRTANKNCLTTGGLPDSACTPGAVFASATAAEICVKGYSKTVRSVTVSTKKSIYAAYGTPYPQPTGSYEADHLIPLELGGSNDIANLFPESADPKPGFHEKDLVENYLHNEVCAGDISLAYAQQQIAADWLVVWNALSPAEISLLKSQY